MKFSKYNNPNRRRMERINNNDIHNRLIALSNGTASEFVKDWARANHISFEEF